MNGERFMVDDCGTLIDMSNRNTYDYLSDVCELLNELHEERNYFERKKCEYWNEFNLACLDNINLRKENEQLKQEKKVFFEIVDAFINGVKDEKGIALENEKFQYAMNEVLKYLIRLKQDLMNPNQYLKNKRDGLNAFEEELEKENEQLKKVLGAILLEVKRDISNTNQTGEIKVFINPNSFELISEVLKKYGALKGWYE